MSWERFNDSYSKLTDYLGNQKDLEKYQKGTELFIRTKEVIESLSSFIDDTFQIMKCYIPARAVTKSITFSDRWLEKAYPKITQDYKNAISFADPIVVANNVIKHDHGRLCQLNVNAHLLGNAYGFYIQNVDSTGAIVPCVEVHPLYRGRRTAYSYNRFLIEVLAYYYLIASQAEKALIRVVKEQSGYDYERGNMAIDSETYINTISKMNATLTNILFEDEYSICPQVEWNGQVLTVRDVADKTFLRRFKNYDGAQIHAVFTGDGFSKTWGLPYMGKAE